MGKSFEEKVLEPIAGIKAMGMHLEGFRAVIEGRVVTLRKYPSGREGETGTA